MWSSHSRITLQILRMSLSISMRLGSARQDCSPGLQPLEIHLSWLFWSLFTSLPRNYSMSSHFSSWNTLKGAELLKAWLHYLRKSAASQWLTHSGPITLNTNSAQKVMLQFFTCSPAVTAALHSQAEGERLFLQLSLIFIDISLAEQGWMSPFIQRNWAAHKFCQSSKHGHSPLCIQFRPGHL